MKFLLAIDFVMILLDHIDLMYDDKIIIVTNHICLKGS